MGKLWLGRGPHVYKVGDELPESWQMNERRREIFMSVIQINPFKWDKYKRYEE
jgi:hypothetical protein